MAASPTARRATEVEPAPTPEADTARALYERHGSRIFGYCLHQLGSREEAEDAVQTTFLNAFRGLRRGVEPELETAWLFKIAHNVCLSRRRSAWRRRRVETPGDLDAIQDLLPAPPRESEELVGLRQALAGMPEQQRRAILLREWQGLSYREIAAELELSQSAVETLIFRARRSLAQGLKDAAAAPWRRVRDGVNAGSLLTGLKSLLAGSAAAKFAAGVAVVATATVVAGPPLEHHFLREHPAPARPTVRQAPAPAPAAARDTSIRGASPAPAVRPGRREVERAALRAVGKRSAAPAPPGAARRAHGGSTAKSPERHELRGPDKPVKTRPEHVRPAPQVSKAKHVSPAVGHSRKPKPDRPVKPDPIAEPDHPVRAAKPKPPVAVEQKAQLAHGVSTAAPKGNGKPAAADAAKPAGPE